VIRYALRAFVGLDDVRVSPIARALANRASQQLIKTALAVPERCEGGVDQVMPHSRR
jgi:hypothetical protein